VDGGERDSMEWKEDERTSESAGEWIEFMIVIDVCGRDRISSCFFCLLLIFMKTNTVGIALLEERRARCCQWIDRPSPTPSFDEGDTPDSEVDADIENGDADGFDDEVNDDAGELVGVKDDEGPSVEAL